MYNLRLPWRKLTFVDKDKKFTSINVISEKTKSELEKENKDKGTLISYSRGFITVQADRDEISEIVFDRAILELENMEV
jgi:hypothetical protein